MEINEHTPYTVIKISGFWLGIFKLKAFGKQITDLWQAWESSDG